MTLPGYADLSPPQVLAALDGVGLRGDGRILQLNSYENRVFQVFLEDGGAVVAKFYRPGRWSDAQILEEHGFALELAAAEVPVVAPLVLQAAAGLAAPDGSLRLAGRPTTLAHADGHRFAVTPRRAGREAELDAPGVLERIGRFIGRLHAVGRERPFAHRVRMDLRGDGRAAFAALEASGFVPPDQHPAWADGVRRALDAVDAALARFEARGGAPATLRLHGDCHLGNLLWQPGTAGGEGTPHIVDLDDAMQGPAVQDLWMLVSGDRETMHRQLDRLLDGYESFLEFDDRERALIEPLRTLRMLRHSAWLAARWSDPSFPRAFPFFDTAAYWNQQAVQLREQAEAMTEGG